jgi:hypothetical protein
MKVMIGIDPHKATHTAVAIDNTEPSVRVHVPGGLGVDQGPMGAVDGLVRAGPHPNPAHRRLPRPDDRSVARHTTSRTAGDSAPRCRHASAVTGRELRPVLPGSVYPAGTAGP